MYTPRSITARRLFAGLTLAGLLVLPALAMAGKEGRGRGHGNKLDRVCATISCSEQQREDLRRVFAQLRQDLEADREALRELRKQLADEWLADKPDERKLARIAEKIAAHERNIADRRLEAMLEIHALLSPEQRKQAVELLKAKRE